MFYISDNILLRTAGRAKTELNERFINKGEGGLRRRRVRARAKGTDTVANINMTAD